MATWIKYALVIAVVAVVAFLLTPIVFAVPETGPQPTTGQVANFMVLGAWDSVLLGVAVAVAAFGWPSVRRAFPDSMVAAVAVFVSLIFMFANWWAHVGFHSTIGDNLTALIAVDYAFHVPLGIAALILLWAVFRLGSDKAVRAVGRADAARAPRAESPTDARTRNHRHEV